MWVWPPACPDPVICGRFAVRAGVGAFVYDGAYLARRDAVPLDPVHLPTTGPGPRTETRHGGLFGVFHDAEPYHFERALLEARHGIVLRDGLAALELAEGDVFGAVAVCGDVTAKAAHRPPWSSELFTELARLRRGQECGRAVYALKGVAAPYTVRERPRITVRHNGRHWLAKLPDPAAGPHGLLGEFAAMRVARRLGLDVADVEFHRLGTREVLLVRRFDRAVDPLGRVLRRLYASAGTILGLGRGSPDERDRYSYLALARALQGVCSPAEAGRARRELWRRMVFNVVCGNGDDHPSNHGFVFRGGAWTLSPAFDIEPCPGYRGVQAMALNAAGSCAGTRSTLLSDCQAFGWAREEAAEFIEQARRTFADGWPAEVEAAGFHAESLPARPPSWLDRNGGA